MSNIIYKWNDDSTYTGGQPPKQYHKGDIVPLHIFPPNILKQHMMYGRIIKCEPQQIPDVSLSISVMAHPQRANFFQGLSEKPVGGIPWRTTGNQYVGEMYRKTSASVKIFPSGYFNPEHYTGEKYSGNGKIYARHFYGSTIENTYEKGV